ncbi:RNA-binding protein [Chitinophagales bacterium]|nr:RNA-binding protein [Chitinophagales bacterium]
MNIFVASLSYDTDEGTLREAFEAFGEVDSVKIVTDRDTGRSKGFGFVEMTDDATAKAAIEALNDSEIAGRTIVVKEARPREERGGGGGGGFRGGNGGGGFRGGNSGGGNSGGGGNRGGGFRDRDRRDDKWR